MNGVDEVWLGLLSQMMSVVRSKGVGQILTKGMEVV